MRVGFYLADQNPHRDRSLGITAYTAGLLREFGARSEIVPLALTSASSFAPEGIPAAHRFPLRTDRAPARFFIDNFHPLLRDAPVDLWHYPKGHLPLFCRYNKPVVGTVHDVILQYYADHYPESRSRAAFTYWLSVLKRSVARFDLVLTVSTFSHRAIEEFCARHRLRCPPVRVTYEGVDRAPGVPLHTAKDNKVLHLASTEPHKRTGTLLRYWKQLCQVEKELPSLQVIGHLRATDMALAESLPHVSLHGRLGATELRVQMSSARALLLTSEIEGFGLPAVEAYLAGTPVVYVRRTAVEEILGDEAPGGFELDDFESFRAALAQVLALPDSIIERRAEQLATRFSWASAAERTLAAYRECPRPQQLRRA